MRERAQPTHAAAKLVLAFLVTLFCMAPVPGDVGGCGQAVEELDAPTFFATKRAIDCDRCHECEIVSEACSVACDRKRLPALTFPDGCYPLVHDGEVCLRALLYASCADYRDYVGDQAPTSPGECNFCPPEGK